ncbi:CDC50 Cell division control protein 50 [Candida maltosa Xu316]|uniref:Cell division control protein 50 n=1 Tax=Candida maltosa (strain Xu316) TaxID=1245528 RepID=M3K5S4_CANMX|nr:Cell division control protein 50 [Candida maltosa Xu316]
MNFLRKRRSSEDDDDDDDILNNDPTSAIHKSRKPPNTAFRQQRLKAWQPILTPKSVIPLLILLAIIFTPLGIAIIYTTYNVQEVNVNYSKCDTEATDTFQNIPKKYIGYHQKSNPNFKWRLENNDTCIIQFDISGNWKPPIFLYYKLTNFYQNHRKYVESYDLDQLRGQALSSDDTTDNCKPLKHRTYKGEQKLIYPCGLIANSYFNDTISDPVLLNARNGDNNETYAFSYEGISWPSDRNHKFQKTQYKPDEVVPPPNWDAMFPDGYTEDNMPDLQTWEHLQNWMRTAALPSFYKLYGQNKSATLQEGTYQINVGLNYPVEIFGGTKSLVITTNSIFGGRNMSLGVIYVIVAVVALVLGIAFLLQYLIKPRKLGDHNYLQDGAGGGGDVTNYREQL